MMTLDLTDQGYEVLEQCDEGGVATVWRARHMESDRRVAVKLLKARGLDWETIQRFAQEVKILEELQHPNIVRVYDTGVEPETGSPYVVMEWAGTETLRVLLLNRPQPSRPHVVQIIRQICAALAAAHAHDIVHRDLKPENVIVSEGNTVKVFDFGMAKVLRSGAAALTSSKHLCGTPQYMAPERARGEPACAGSDVYAAAIIAYEMIAGVRPFDDAAPMRVMVMQANEAPPPLQGLPAGAWEILAAALDKDPQERPSAVEFANALTAALDG